MAGSLSFTDAEGSNAISEQHDWLQQQNFEQSYRNQGSLADGMMGAGSMALEPSAQCMVVHHGVAPPAANAGAAAEGSGAEALEPEQMAPTPEPTLAKKRHRDDGESGLRRVLRKLSGNCTRRSSVAATAKQTISCLVRQGLSAGEVMGHPEVTRLVEKAETAGINLWEIFEAVEDEAMEAKDGAYRSQPKASAIGLPWELPAFSGDGCALAPTRAELAGA